QRSTAASRNFSPTAPSTRNSANRPQRIISAPPPTTRLRRQRGSVHHPLPARFASEKEKLSSNPLPQVLPRHRYTEKGAFRYLVSLAVSSTSSALSALPLLTE